MTVKLSKAERKLLEQLQAGCKLDISAWKFKDRGDGVWVPKTWRARLYDPNEKHGWHATFVNINVVHRLESAGLIVGEQPGLPYHRRHTTVYRLAEEEHS